jgi:hypothetical protein
MSERVARFVLALSLLVASPVAAQDADSLRARLDSIGAEYRATAEALRAHRQAVTQARAAAVAEELDTAAVGPFLVVARPRELSTAARYFAAAWSHTARLLGELRDSVGPHTFLVSAGGRVPVFETMRAGNEDVVFLRSWRYGRPLTAAAEAAIGRLLQELVPQSVRSWTGSGLMQATPWDAVYRALALSAAMPARACLAGDAAACLEALVVDSAGAKPEAWYPLRQLQALALARPDPTGGRAQRACQGGDAAECVGLLPWSRVPPPLPQYHRLALAQLALEQGGAGAFARLARQDTSATVAERLEAAAGVPLEQLAREWRARALAARPNANAGIGVSLAATLVWSLVFLPLATRSTRCRAG